MNNAIPFSLIFWGQLSIESGLASILNGTTAVFGVVVAGIFHGRKNGMSQELFNTMKWLALLTLSALVYLPIGELILRYIPIAPIYGYVSAYILANVAIAALLVGGATVTRVTIWNAVVGTFLFHTLIVVVSLAGQVMQIANEPESDASGLTAAMESDVALSARVLKCVNSSAYATRRKITNLQQAIAYLGTKQIRNLAVTAAVSDLFKNDEAIGIYCRSNLWKHLVSVGICARMIAKRLDSDEAEDIFLAGLLHDIGIVLEDQHVHDHFLAVIGSLDKNRTLAQVERDIMGFDHTTLGEKVAENWKFPESITAVIRHHHMSAHYRGDESDLVRCVEVANFICSLKSTPSVGLQLVRFSKPALAALELSKEDVLVLADDLQREIVANKSLFQV